MKILFARFVSTDMLILKKYNKESEDFIMKKYVCEVCGWVYDEELGLPEKGIAPGTKFEDLPEDFECVLCGVGKGSFVEE